MMVCAEVFQVSRSEILPSAAVLHVQRSQLCIVVGNIGLVVRDDGLCGAFPSF